MQTTNNSPPKTPTQNQNSINVEGCCDQIIFQNADTGYSIFKLTTATGKLICLGSSPLIQVGQNLKVEGNVIENPKYGQQIQCEVITSILPKTAKGIIKYLSSGIIPGIGEGFAKKLVDFAGKELFSILDNEPEKLYTIKGIGKKRLELLAKNWQEYRSAHEVMMFLQQFGIGAKRSMLIYHTYQDRTLEILNNNPYQIYQDISGIGFKIADQIAKSAGIENDAPKRIEAGVQYTLEMATSSGHCFLPMDAVIKSSCKLLDLSSLPELSTILDEKRFLITDDGHIYLSKTYQAERQIEQSLMSLNQNPSIWENHPLEHYLMWIDETNHIDLSRSQRNALYTILQSKIGIITGGPGVGKTTLTKSLIHLAKRAKMSTMLCAPTGRAAKKLSSSTGQEAKTIHRLLKMDPVERKFQHHKNNPLQADLIIIDEASMIDVFLANHLLQAIDPLSNIIIIGDIDQLPSVGPGAFLKDMISLYPDQTAMLTEIFRQAQDSKIIQNAHLVNKGKMLIPNEQNLLSDFYFIPEQDPEAVVQKIMKLITDRIPNKFSLNPVEDIQLLCPMHKGTLGTQRMNELLQSSLNAHNPKTKTKFKVGDKVIQTRNNYDKDVFNGDVGYVQSIDEETHEVVVDFQETVAHYLFAELDELQLAYAISIHKSQGSEYPAVIIPLAMQHFTLLERNLLYTAITRGKKLVILVGEMKAVAMAIRNKKSRMRNTDLSINPA